MKIIKITESQLCLLKESLNTITLNQIYSEDYPDESELIWEFVSEMDFNDKFQIKTFNPIIIYNNWEMGNGTTIKEAFENYADKDQKRIVKYYMKNLNEIKNKFIVTNGNMLVDGFHRVTALALSDIDNIKGIDLEDNENN